MTSYKQKTKVLVKMPTSGQCPYCDWSSQKGTTFSMHISRKHASEAGKEVNPYKCSYCQLDFSAKTHLNHHIANHHEINLINCCHDGCTYKGKNKTSIISHYVNKHMPNIVKECKAHNKCVSCDRTGTITPYHIGKCHKESPFNNSGECKECE
jgi:hypothetical protein